MDSAIIVAFLTISASAIGYVISHFVSFWENKRTYKNEYYKKIITKRFLAYETLEAILSNMQLTYQLKESEYFIFFEGKDSFIKFLSIVNSCNVAVWWLNQEIIDKIYDFNKFLMIEFFLKMNNSDLIELGIKHHVKLREYYYQIRNLLLQDLENLYEVENFINTKKQNISKYSYNNR